MATRQFVFVAGLAALAAAPAFASVTVIGSNLARICYQSASASGSPTFRQLLDCDNAFHEGPLLAEDRVATHVNRGILRLRRGRVAAAVADFDSAIALDPNQPEAYLNKGGAFIRMDDPAGAAELFTVAIERNTRRPAIAHYGRAIANERMGDVRAAYRDYRRASEIAPDWDAPREDLRRFQVARR